MDSIFEVKKLLIIELLKYNFDIDFEINKRQYYNEYLGDTSIFLSSLFELEMKRNVIEWDKRWIDDCLIKIVNNQPDIISLNGEMIWAKKIQQSNGLIRFILSYKKIIQIGIKIKSSLNRVI